MKAQNKLRLTSILLGTTLLTATAGFANSPDSDSAHPLVIKTSKIVKHDSMKMEKASNKVGKEDKLITQLSLQLNNEYKSILLNS